MGAEVPQRGSSDTAHLKDLDLSYVTFGAPDLTTLCDLDSLSLVVVGQRVDAGFTATRVGTVDKFQDPEAAVAIVSLAASSADEIPRGEVATWLP